MITLILLILALAVIGFLVRAIITLQKRTEGLVVHILDIEKDNATYLGKIHSHEAAQLVWASTGNCAQACLNYQALEKGADEDKDNYEQQWLSHNEAIANLSTKLSFAEQDRDVLYKLSMRLIEDGEDIDFTKEERELLEFLKMRFAEATGG